MGLYRVVVEADPQVLEDQRGNLLHRVLLPLAAGMERDPGMIGEPDPIPNDSESIHLKVIRDLEERRQFGLRKYGTVLQAHNGRDALHDLYEELLDACCYIRQVMEERDGQPSSSRS